MALAHSAKTVLEQPQFSSLMASFKVRCSGVGGAILCERSDRMLTFPVRLRGQLW